MTIFIICVLAGLAAVLLIAALVRSSQMGGGGSCFLMFVYNWEHLVDKENMMGRELRMVPKNWSHPRNWRGDYKPLADGKNFEKLVAEWKEGYQKWEDGFKLDWPTKEWIPKEADDTEEYWEYDGDPPHEDEYMLVGIPAEQRTHFMMYEDTTEGTPISPAFETAEELARWLADNNASAFGGRGASYEAWLDTIKRGWSFSGAWSPGTGLISGVEAGISFRESDA